MTRIITRRALAAGGVAGAQVPVLRIGNQKGGLRSLLEASGAANSLPYYIGWNEFPATTRGLVPTRAESAAPRLGPRPWRRRRSVTIVTPQI